MRRLNLPRSKRRQLIGVALLAVLSIFFFKKLTADPANPRILPKLERIVTAMQENRLLSYRNQDWCEGISGEEGSYSTVKTAERCERVIGKPKPFDSQARARFDNVRDVAKKLGRGVDNVWLLYKREGDLRYAEIILSCFWCRESYVFSNDGKNLPPEQKSPKLVAGGITSSIQTCYEVLESAPHMAIGGACDSRS